MNCEDQEIRKKVNIVLEKCGPGLCVNSKAQIRDLNWMFYVNAGPVSKNAENFIRHEFFFLCFDAVSFWRSC